MCPTIDEDAIYEILTNTLLSARLAPGTQLGELKLVAVFGVTRERIRKILHKLGHKRLIDLIPNRGAFVVNAGLDETRQLYEARRVVETGIVLSVVETASNTDLARLKAHVEIEDAALGRDLATSNRLSGGFHLELAKLTANDFIIRQMQELLIRTIMLDSYFDATLQHHTSISEHRGICDAIEERDGPAAADAMAAHLLKVERRFKPTATTPVKSDLEAVLRDEVRKWRDGAEMTRL
ncbi:GntR family transcriptional regulator [Pseudooceanicola sp.]|uniref:GntR family transcriptional regulator n=1 Tax=Pseudooceanicola sp. TaxID=1914328 RepID=UPI00260C7CDE|nr:GntR family transcriptional regulator [Pseudooceanicola sp.]MDF1856069.1 GntR family transcriptional regulator [Pseudooceanicola sp.]